MKSSIISIFPEILPSLDWMSIHSLFALQDGKMERRQDGKELIAVLPLCP